MMRHKLTVSMSQHNGAPRGLYHVTGRNMTVDTGGGMSIVVCVMSFPSRGPHGSRDPLVSLSFHWILTLS